MTRPVEIAPLTGLHHLAPVLAGWHHDEWGHLYAPDVWNRDTAVAEFVAMAEPGSTDRTWVAFDGPARDADAVLGSVSLVASDDLAGFEHLTPWLASMFVVPAARGRGVASMLTDALLDGARAVGHDVVYLFTSGQQRFWADRGWSVVAALDVDGHSATVMARSTHRRAARRAVSSQWCADPDHQGAYSHLRLGGTPAHRQRLAEEILPGLWFAGEATSVAHPATMHGAWFSGERAAAQVLAEPARRRVVVVGAGLAGLAAARRLHDDGCEVVVVEAKDVPGGRIRTDTSTGRPLPLGGSWLHGNDGHPLRDRVTTVAADWAESAFYAVGVGRLDDARRAAVEAAYHRVHAAYAQAAPGTSVADVITATVDSSAFDPVVAAAVTAWLTAECEGLYGAPAGDIAANGGFEPFELPGGDHLVTSDLGAVAHRLAAGLDVRLATRVRALRRVDEHWAVELEPTDPNEANPPLVTDAVVLTAPIGALRADRFRFTPPLPADVQAAVASIGCGPIAKVFATFDEVWWPRNRPMRLSGVDHLTTVVDMTTVAGCPTLVGFVVGEAARRVERMSEHELCRLFDHELAAASAVRTEHAD